MEKFKIYGCLFLALLSCFLLGTYTVSVKPIELHRWIITSLFGLFFLVVFLTDYKNIKN